MCARARVCVHMSGNKRIRIANSDSVSSQMRINFRLMIHNAWESVKVVLRIIRTN